MKDNSFSIIAIAGEELFGSYFYGEGSLPSVLCPASGTEYCIKIPRVEFTCLLVDKTVTITRNSVG